MASLAFLSLQRVPLGRRGEVRAPSREERVAAYRAQVPAQFANQHPWKWCRPVGAAQVYELDAIADSQPLLDEIKP